ncbi:thioesterase family protein [Mesorhizobium sp. M0700]|uniref:thioesterase family protein n=1 Tax=Mesorhizobium sp. M0700 TaxID=2956988 RepID=UPI003337A713
MRSFIYEDVVRDEWLDFNRHMRDAYYGLVFSYAVDNFMDRIGLDETYRNTTRGTLYTIEDHKRYLLELKASEKITVATMILNCDSKKLHLYQRMTSGSRVRAICESLQLHVTQGDPPRSSAMPDQIAATVQYARLEEKEIFGLEPRSAGIGIRR